MSLSIDQSPRNHLPFHRKILVPAKRSFLRLQTARRDGGMQGASRRRYTCCMVVSDQLLVSCGSMCNEETAKKVGTIVSAKRVTVSTRGRDRKRVERGEKKKRAKRGTESFATPSAEILPSVESIMPGSESFSCFFFDRLVRLYRPIGF